MTALSKALLMFQGLGVHLQMDAINPHYKNRYISLEALMAVVMPLLNKCGLVLLQMPTQVGGEPALTTRIVEATSGEFVEATMLLSLAKVDPQSQGSALTYARRYALMAFLGLVADEDTDGSAPKSRRSAGGTAESTAGAAEKPMASTRSAAPADGNDESVPGAKRDPKYATYKQTGFLWQLAKENGVGEEALREIIVKYTGQPSGGKIPKEKFDSIKVAVQSYQLAQALASGTADDVPFE